MRLDRDRWIFMALLVLDEACDDCSEGPIPPSFSIRLALASLYALGAGEKDMFEDFWREMRTKQYPGNTPTQNAYMRSTYTRTHFSRIARSVGIDLSIDYCKRMHKARRRA